MTEEEKKAIEISKLSLCVAHEYNKRNMIYNTASLETLLDLLEKQQKEIEELKEITKTYDSYIGEKLPLDSKIIIADREYFINGTFVNKFISKDKIIHTLLKFQNEYGNEYGEDLEVSPKFFIGKELLQYGEDMIDEIAKALDIKLLEE